MTSLPDRFCTQVSAHQIVTARCGVSFVEQQIDHAQHTIDSRGQIVRAWWIDNYAMIPDLSFRTHETLRDRCLRREKRTRDLRGAEAAGGFECERDLILDRKRRMATHQDQRQLVVHFDAGISRRLFSDIRQGQFELSDFTC